MADALDTRIPLERIEEMERAAEKAGGSEWFVDRHPSNAGLAWVDDGASMWPIQCEWPQAEFIARANPQTILSLIREIKHYRASEGDDNPLVSYEGARFVGEGDDPLVAVPLRLLDQVKADYASAHAELMKAQGTDPERHTWPEWSPQANTLRWIDTLHPIPEEKTDG